MMKLMDYNSYLITKEMKSSKIFLLFGLLSILIVPSISLTSSSSTLAITTYTTPTNQCSSFCMYQINTAYNYDSMCTQPYSVGANLIGNGYCTKCDPLLFRPIAGLAAGTFYCIPHLYNS